jgi:hypothetical protein
MPAHGFTGATAEATPATVFETEVMAGSGMYLGAGAPVRGSGALLGFSTVQPTMMAMADRTRIRSVFLMMVVRRACSSEAIKHTRGECAGGKVRNARREDLTANHAKYAKGERNPNRGRHLGFPSPPRVSFPSRVVRNTRIVVPEARVGVAGVAGSFYIVVAVAGLCRSEVEWTGWTTWTGWTGQAV